MVMASGMARPGGHLSPQDWIDAALAAIAADGLAAVAVEPLAARLGTSKGSFYWHFASRDALLEAALANWEQQYTTEVTAASASAPAGHTPAARLRLLIERVTAIAETDAVAAALVASASHPIVGPVLDRVTRHRISYTADLFREMGFTPAQADHRALLAYSAYLGHAELNRSALTVLPRTGPARRAYLDHVMAVLTSPPPVE
jgi:AcrR family transcriptional regulator